MKSNPTVKYLKPKILLLDLPYSSSKALSAKGFNVQQGTLGSPYKVEKRSGYAPLIANEVVPNQTEQEIIVVDLAYGELESGPKGAKHTPNAEPDLWGKCDLGFLDPRVRITHGLLGDFDRTHSVGGIFVIFADARTGIETCIARANTYASELYDQEDFPYDAWYFLSELRDLTVENDAGEEMFLSKSDSSLAKLLGKHLPGGRFTCGVEGGYRGEDPWEKLAENKFGNPVAICRCRAEKGSVIILPQIADKTGFLTELFTEVLPEIAPHLFPDIEQGKWIHHPEYELPRVIEIKAMQAGIEQKAQAEIAELEKALAIERGTNGWVHNLLNGTDAELVEAVKMALHSLGFTELTDVDQERDRLAGHGKSRESLKPKVGVGGLNQHAWKC